MASRKERIVGGLAEGGEVFLKSGDISRILKLYFTYFLLAML
jgi:hypothetical protein